MKACVRVLVEANQLVNSRLVRLKNEEKLDPILEAQRTAVICRNVIDQGLVTLKECEALYRGCSLTNDGVLEPRRDVMEAFQNNILERLRELKRLDETTLQIATGMLTSVMRLFIEYGMMRQVGLNQRMVDHKIPMSPNRLDRLSRLIERIDRQHWLWIAAHSGQGALVATSTSIKRAVRATHTSAPKLRKQDDYT